MNSYLSLQALGDATKRIIKDLQVPQVLKEARLVQRQPFIIFGGHIYRA